MGDGGPARDRRGGAGLALGLVLAAGFVNYLDRVTLSVAGPVIAGELRLRPGQLGLLYSAFLWTYGLAQAPVGALIDRVGPRPLLGAALTLWSAAQGATGPRSLIATTSMSRRANSTIERSTSRPIRPNPLMATRRAMRLRSCV